VSENFVVIIIDDFLWWSPKFWSNVQNQTWKESHMDKQTKWRLPSNFNLSKMDVALLSLHSRLFKTY